MGKSYKRICKDIQENPFVFKLSYEDAKGILEDPNVPQDIKDNIIDRRDQLPTTNENVIDYMKKKSDRNLLQTKFDDLGGFIFAIYKNLDLMYSDDVLSQLDKARLLLLATYINYNENKLVYPNGKSITRSHLSGILRISEDRVRIFMNKMKELELIKISDAKELYISNDLFFKGTADKQLYNNEYIGYARIFINTYQYLYETMDKRKLKYLGIIYNMLGYINFYHNVLCLEGITEQDENKLKVMTLEELYNICNNKTDITPQAISKFKIALSGIKLDNGQPLFAFVKVDKVDKILINPYLTYKSSNIDTFTETLKVIFNNNTNGKKIKKSRK